jgi:hypothetical protein
MAFVERDLKFQLCAAFASQEGPSLGGWRTTATDVDEHEKRKKHTGVHAADSLRRNSCVFKRLGKAVF